MIHHEDAAGFPVAQNQIGDAGNLVALNIQNEFLFNGDHLKAVPESMKVFKVTDSGIIVLLAKAGGIGRGRHGYHIVITAAPLIGQQEIRKLALEIFLEERVHQRTELGIIPRQFIITAGAVNIRQIKRHRTMAK